jgi:ABC-2 type transport system permease protein
MSNIIAIARKELKVYFASPLFYIVTALFVFITGAFFAATVVVSSSASGDQKQEGTIELLLTNPVTETQLVLGKYLAALAMFGAMVVTTLLQVLILMIAAVDKHHVLFLSVGNIDTASLIAGYVGNVLILGGYLAIGLLASTVTQNQIIAATASFIALLALLIVGTFAPAFQPPASDFLTALGPNAHMDNFAKGLVSLPDVLYALSLIGVPLYLSVVLLGARRWH